MDTTATVIYRGELRTTATHTRSGSQITTDAPIDNQGKGECFSPTDLLAASLASCIVTIMGITAKNHGFTIDGAKMDIRKVMASNPRRVAEISIDIHFPHNYPDKTKRLLEAAAKECPVAQSLHPSIAQNIALHFPESDR